jgi:hypothetical protein
MGSTAAIGFIGHDFPEFQTTDAGSGMLGIQRAPKR